MALMRRAMLLAMNDDDPQKPYAFIELAAGGYEDRDFALRWAEAFCSNPQVFGESPLMQAIRKRAAGEHRCRGCGGPLDDMGCFGFCSKPDCQNMRRGYRIAIQQLAQSPAILSQTLARLTQGLGKDE